MRFCILPAVFTESCWLEVACDWCILVLKVIIVAGRVRKNSNVTNEGGGIVYVLARMDVALTNVIELPDMSLVEEPEVLGEE